MCWSRERQLTGHKVWRQCQVVSLTPTQLQLWSPPDPDTASRKEGQMASQSRWWLEAGGWLV